MRGFLCLAMAGMMALSGCFLDRSSLGPDYDFFSEVSATRYCASEDLTISWSSSEVRRSEDFCACTIDRGCGDAGSICFDGQCTVSGVSAADAEGRCAEPAFVTVLNITPGTPGPPETIARIRGASGSVTVSPVGSARYDLIMNRSGVLSTQVVEVSEVPGNGPPRIDPLRFVPPNCQPFSSPIGADLALIAPQPLIGSPRVQISRVVQTSNYDVTLSATGPDSTSDRGPVRLPRSGIDDGGAMSGPLGGEWIVQPTMPLPFVPLPNGCQTAGAEPASPIVLNIETMCLAQ